MKLTLDPRSVIGALALVFPASCELADALRDPFDLHDAQLPWYDENGGLRGSLAIEELGTGFEYRYLDADGRTVRIEKRDARRELAPGPLDHHLRVRRTRPADHRDHPGRARAARSGSLRLGLPPHPAHARQGRESRR